MSWIDRALTHQRGIRFDEFAAFLDHGGTTTSGQSRLKNLERAVGLLRAYEVRWPRRLQWAVEVVKNRGRLQRTTENALYLQRAEELRSRFPKIHALVLESWRRGGLQYHGQFAQLLETAELIGRSAPRTVLELGSGVSSAMLAQLIGDASRCTTVEESPHWHQMLQQYLVDFPNGITSVRADRVVTTRDGDPVVHYAIDHARAWDFVYVDGPSNRVDDLPPEQAKRASELDPRSRLPNIDVELMWNNGVWPKTIVIDGRRSTVSRLMRKSAGRYDVFLKSSYVTMARGEVPDYELHHTVMLRKD